MGNMHLVTGYAGKEHVKAEDHGSFYAAIISGGTFVLDKGNKFAINKLSDNMVRIADGDLLMQGRHCRVADGAFAELAVESGQNGYKRRDLVCVRYLRDADTGVEDCNLIVIRGNPVAASPVDPEYANGDIISGALQKDFPLYRLNLNGTAIESIDTLFTVFPSIENSRSSVAAEFASVWATFTKYDAGLVKIAYGSYTGTGTTGAAGMSYINFDFTPMCVIVQEYEANYAAHHLIAIRGCAEVSRSDSSNNTTMAVWTYDKSFAWYSLGTSGAALAESQFNTSGKKYCWFAIGL